MRIKLFAKNKPGLSEAIGHLKKLTNDVEIYIGDRKDSLPSEAYKNNCDLIISYISPWIIPKELLKTAESYSINFHPGPPEYPGIGCTNFALYENAKEFGVTCHIMESKVDSGKIISVIRFPIKVEDSVYTLTNRCYEAILIQFYDVINQFYSTGEFRYIKETWTRKPFTRKELNDLSIITKDMSFEEISRRIRATYYPGMPYPYIDINGYKFVYNES